MRDLARAFGSFAAAYTVTILVTRRETGTVQVREVAEACIVVEVRAIGFKALRLLAIVLSSLEPILVALAHCRFAITKNVLTIVAAIWRPRIVAAVIAPTVATETVITPTVVAPAVVTEHVKSVSVSKRPIGAIRVRANNYASPPLRLNCAR